MAGHSQFKNIMYRKGAQDAKRAKLFAKLAREVTVAARGGPDPDMNARLRSAIAAARGANMPKDNIERAVARGSGGGDDANFEEIRYEGYGPGGVAVIVEALTDNRNRTAAAIRATFGKFGGSLGETNSVAFNFDRVGEVRYDADVADADGMFEAALEAGAEDVVSGGDGHEIYCAADDLNTVSVALEAQFGEPMSARLVWRPRSVVEVDEKAASSLFALLEALDDNDDAQQVAANFDVPDEVLERLNA